jgi:hypothetical protein
MLMRAKVEGYLASQWRRTYSRRIKVEVHLLRAAVRGCDHSRVVSTVVGRIGAIHLRGYPANICHQDQHFS